MTNAQQDDARAALFAGIARVCGEISDWTQDKQAEILKDLAAAYRFTSGGTQPGSSVLDKN